uniref:Putative pleiotropic drug resistance pdr1-15 abc superfamily protein n=1 Tax=Nyssomyia neivai TaxID=330878 RepID=A0A1L8E493_9DIPT
MAQKMTKVETKPRREGLKCWRSEDGSSSENSVAESSDCQPNNNTMFHSNNANGDATYSFPRREAIDISFRNLKYTVKSVNITKCNIETKEILKGISGTFESGRLTAIMGPSGAGKSTLLNVLASYVERGVTGTVKVNGKNRSANSQKFREMSAYIHQDDALRPWLKVSEAMIVAAHLKLGYSVSHEYKINLVRQILVLLGLEKRYNTFTAKLSGGQKKRLAIALELINNPPILFLDEPTTGLDSSSCTQCISLLKRLAQEGRTVICTIHQPSALLFEMFDDLYTVSQGYCIYQGIVKELVPFLSDIGLQCPNYHNPADFLIEVASGEYGTDMSKMSMIASSRKREDTKRAVIPSENEHEGTDFGNFIPPPESGGVSLAEAEKLRERKESIGQRKPKQGASIFMQFILLFWRNLICHKRHHYILVCRIMAHTIIGAIFGYLYSDVGTLATTVFGNYVYVYGSMLLVVYTGKMSVMMSFPVEMEMLKREHFNRWYKLGPYFFSIILFEIPFQMICASSYIIISYWLTGNYTDDWRFFYFLILALLGTLCAQSWGFFFGATLPVKIAVFAGPVIAVLFSVFGFCNRYIDITPLFRWMWHISYYRVGFHGLLNTIFGMNRRDLKCPDTALYCHFKKSNVFLTEMMINDMTMESGILMMSLVIVVMHILTITVLWIKLNKR